MILSKPRKGKRESISDLRNLTVSLRRYWTVPVQKGSRTGDGVFGKHESERNVGKLRTENVYNKRDEPRVKSGGRG